MCSEDSCVYVCGSSFSLQIYKSIVASDRSMYNDQCRICLPALCFTEMDMSIFSDTTIQH